MDKRERAKGISHQQAQDLITLCQVSQTYLGQHSAEEILETSCRMAVERFGLKMAWVGLIDADSVDVRPAKAYGAEVNYLDVLRITQDRGPTGRGPTGTAIRTRQAAVANDIATDPTFGPWREEALKRGFRSSAAFPLRTGDRVLGTLNVYSAQPGDFPNERIRVLQSFADLTAIALERAWLHEKTRRHAQEQERHIAERTDALIQANEQLQQALADRAQAEKALRRALEETAHSRRLLLALSQVSQAVLRAHTQEEIFQVVTDEAAKLSYHVIILIVAEDQEHLVIPKGSLKPSLAQALEKLSGLTVEDFRLPLLPGSPYQKILTKPDAVFRDREASIELIAEALPQHLRPLTSRLVGLLGIKQSICAPLMLDGKPIGLLAMSGADLTEADVPVVATFANQIAIALENTRLHQEAQAWAAELERRVAERTQELSKINRELEAEIAGRQKLEEMWRRYEAIVNTSGEFMTLVNRDYVYEAANHAYCRAHGKEQNEIVGHTIAEVWGEERFNTAIKLLLDECFTGKEVRHQGWFEFPTLGLRCFDVAYYPFRSNGGEVTHAIVISRDITERKQAERALQQYVERLQVLHEIDQAILTARSLQEIAQIVTQHVPRLLPCTVIGVVIPSDEAHTVNTLAVGHGGEPVAMDTHDIPLGAFSELQECLETLRRGEIYVLKDLAVPHQLIPALQSRWAEALRALVIVPLIAQEELIGALFLGMETPVALDSQQTDIAREVADSLATAIQNAQQMEVIRGQRSSLEMLSRQLIYAQEAERKRISQELHDEIGQIMTMIRINLAALEQLLPSETPPTVRQMLTELEELSQQALEQARELSLDLRPAILDDLGLVPALRWYLNRYASRLDAKIDLEVIDFDERPSAEVETVLYRVAQEALTNVARHAQASHVHIRLERKATTVTLLIEDDGQGFDTEEIMRYKGLPHGLGLLGIQERVTFLGGHVDIQSRPGRGTRLFIEIPWSVEDEQSTGAAG